MSETFELAVLGGVILLLLVNAFLIGRASREKEVQFWRGAYGASMLKRRV